MVVDQAYLISVADLRDICKELTKGKFVYRVTDVQITHVNVLFNNGDELNDLVYEFPIVTNIWFPTDPEDGMLVALHVFLQTNLRHGLYLHEGEVKRDGLEDWDKFWTPLDALLYKHAGNH